jgi:hypothetical protein
MAALAAMAALVGMAVAVGFLVTVAAASPAMAVAAYCVTTQSGLAHVLL